MKRILLTILLLASLVSPAWVWGATYCNEAVCDSQGAIIKNNIISSKAGKDVYYTDAVSVSDTVLDYNIWYVPTGNLVFENPDAYVGLTLWQAEGYDAHSLSSDPLFVSTSNFRLKAASPARNAGTDVSLTTDYIGRTVPHEGTQDMGHTNITAVTKDYHS